MRKLISKNKLFWSRKEWRRSGFLSLILLVISLFVNYGANVYVTLRGSNYVSDLFLDNLPVVNVGWIFFQGTAVFFLFVLFLLAREPKKFPFVIKCLALFILVRSAFISLTHLAAPPEQPVLKLSNMFAEITSGNDLFFSSHTGIPFLMALIFWNNKRLRVFFIFTSLFFGASVLLGHLHYSIDVFAAFFITYGIYQITRRLFPADEKLFLESEGEGSK